MVLEMDSGVAPLISRVGKTTPAGALISSSAAMASPFVADGAILGGFGEGRSLNRGLDDGGGFSFNTLRKLAALRKWGQSLPSPCDFRNVALLKVVERAGSVRMLIRNT